MAQIIYQIVTGTPDFTVTINPNVKPDQTHAALGVYSFDNVPDGTYIITITDSVGCVVYLNVTISENCVLEGTILCVTTTSTTTLNNCVLEGDIQCYVTTSTTTSTSSTTTTTTTIIIEEFSILYNTPSEPGSPTSIYAYNPDTKVSTLLPVPNITNNSLDIAHTSDKLWIFVYFTNAVLEWDITMSPFTAIFNRQVNGVLYNAGLCAKDNITLVSSNAMNSVYECDISTNISVNTLKFLLPADRKVSGDFVLTTNNKLIITTILFDTSDDAHISQYDYSTGTMEVDIDIDSTIPHPYGVHEYDDEIYITDTSGEIYRIDKTFPYTLTLVDTLPYEVNGASQIPSFITASLVPTTTTTSTTIEPTTTTTSTTEEVTTTTTTTSA